MSVTSSNAARVTCMQGGEAGPLLQQLRQTTFIDVLIPSLVGTFGCALEHHMDRHRPGTGIKKLRLLSKGARLAVQQAVQGYTLKLAMPSPMGDPKAQLETLSESTSLSAFLNRSQLTRLHVSLIPTGSATGDTKLTAQLAAFVTNTSPALSSVTHLTITLPLVIGCDMEETETTKAATAMLVPLAHACPRLQHLTLHGRFGPSFLAHFGSICPDLSRLESVLTNLSPITLQSLATLLPHLTTLTAVPRPPLPMNRYSSVEGKPLEQARDGEAIVTALAACPGLVSVDTGSCEITQAIWQALPVGVHSLGCSTSVCTPLGEKWGQHVGLRRLELMGSVNQYAFEDSGRVGISALALLLAAAPNLSTCHMRINLVVEAKFSRADALSVQALDARIGAGLVLSGTQRAIWKPKGRGPVTLLFETPSAKELLLTDPASDDYKHSMDTFMAPSIMDRPIRCITDIEFHHQDGVREAAGDLTHLSRVFPNVKALTVNNMCLLPSDAAALAACSSLREVVFCSVGGFESKGLRMLCAESKMLRSVGLYACRGISAKEGKKIMGSKGTGKVSGVDIIIDRGDMLGDGGW